MARMAELHAEAQRLGIDATAPDAIAQTLKAQTAEVWVGGWQWPFGALKAHLFRDGRSLCGRYGTLGNVFDGAHNSPPTKDDCVTCRRRLDKITTTTQGGTHDA